MRLRITLAVASIFALTLGSAGAATVLGGTLLNGSNANQIETWLDNSGLYSGPLTFTEIFDDGSGQNSTQFHAAVDGQGPTITIYQARVSGSTDHYQLIGGFNPQSWNSLGAYNITPALSDRTAFLFNLDSGALFQQSKQNPYGQYQTYNNNFYGPTFGGGHDIYVNGSLHGSYMNQYSYCLIDSPTCAAQGPNLLGPQHFLSVEYGLLETYTISASAVATPLPAALPLFATGLGGLGLLARRRKKHAAG